MLSNPPLPTTKGKATLFFPFKNTKENPQLHKRIRGPIKRSFAFPLRKMVLNLPMGLLTAHQSRTTWVLLASFWRVQTRLGVLGLGQGYYEFRLLYEFCTWLSAACGGWSCRGRVWLCRAGGNHKWTTMGLLRTSISLGWSMWPLICDPERRNRVLARKAPKRHTPVSPGLYTKVCTPAPGSGAGSPRSGRDWPPAPSDS